LVKRKKVFLEEGREAHKPDKIFAYHPASADSSERALARVKGLLLREEGLPLRFLETRPGI